MKTLIAFCLVAGSASLHAYDIAHFNSSGGLGTPYAYDGSPVSVPLGANSFTVAVTNSIPATNPLLGTPAWATTGTFPALIPGSPTGTTVAQSALSPAIITALGTTSGLDVFAFKGGAGAVATITLSFANLPGGFLPAGSILAYTDVDFRERATLTGDVSGWFNLGTITALDASNGVTTGTSETDVTPADLTTFGGSGFTLTLDGATLATDTPSVIIPIAANLGSLTITANNPNDNLADFFQSFGIAAVPEPATALLLPLAAGFLLIRRRFKKA